MLAPSEGPLATHEQRPLPRPTAAVVQVIRTARQVEEVGDVAAEVERYLRGIDAWNHGALDEWLKATVTPGWEPVTFDHTEIAERVISQLTVKSHVSLILTTMPARDRTQLVVMAYESGLVVPGLATGA